MEYDPQDYYSDGGEGASEELPPPQTSGLEKPEAPAKRPKKKLAEAGRRTLCTPFAVLAFFIFAIWVLLRTTSPPIRR